MKNITPLRNPIGTLANLAGVPKSATPDHAILVVNYIDEDGDSGFNVLTSCAEGYVFPMSSYIGLAQQGQMQLFLSEQ